MSMPSSAIERVGSLPTISECVTYKDMIFISGQVASDPVPDSVFAQSQSILKIIDRYLAIAGSDRTKILMFSITLVDMNSYAEMDRAVGEWIVEGCVPARASTVQSQLARADWKVEVAAIAAR
jgi:enamine deaminase RidA (YjgF/YER057c/UK114 family)